MSPRLSGVFTEINPSKLIHPVLVALFDYWNQKRGERAMPSRADVSPAGMKAFLGNVVLADAFPDFSDFRYRTIGTRVSGYFAPDSTGKTVQEVFAGYGETVVKGMLVPYRKCARDRVVVRAYGAANWIGKAFLDFESLYLPLSEDGRTANMVLSAVTFELASPLKAPQA